MRRVPEQREYPRHAADGEDLVPDDLPPLERLLARLLLRLRERNLLLIAALLQFLLRTCIQDGDEHVGDYPIENVSNNEKKRRKKKPRREV